jgi:hypothetical protein
VIKLRKVTILLIVLFFFSLLVIAQETTNSPEIDYNNPVSISSAPPDQIDIAQAISAGNGASITKDQWLHGDNLNKAGDISQFSEAHQAVSDKHNLGFAKLNQGSVSYNDGTITNGKISINLNNEDLSGVDIFSLPKGGFAIGRGKSESKFTLDNGDIFELTKSDFQEPIEIRDDGSLFLPSGVEASLSSIGDNKLEITSIGGIEISSSENELVIKGHYNYYFPDEDLSGIGGSDLGDAGKVEFNCESSGICDIQTFENNIIARARGEKIEADDFRIEMDMALILADKDYFLANEALHKRLSKLGPQDWVAKGAVPSRFNPGYTPTAYGNDFNPWVDTLLEVDTDAAFVSSIGPWMAATDVDSLKYSGAAEESTIGQGLSMLKNNQKMTFYKDLSDKTRVTLVPRFSARSGQYGGVIELQFSPSLSGELFTMGITPTIDFGGANPDLKNLQIDSGFHVGIKDGPVSYTLVQDSERMTAIVAYNQEVFSAGVNIWTESAFGKLIRDEEINYPEGGFGFLFEVNK